MHERQPCPVELLGWLTVPGGLVGQAGVSGWRLTQQIWDYPVCKVREPVVGIEGFEISRVRMRAHPATEMRPFPRGTLKWFDGNIVGGKVWEVLFKKPIPGFSFQVLMGLCGPSCHLELYLMLL